MNCFFDKAKALAIKAHGNQVRRYTGEPYWHHLEEVYDIVKNYDTHPCVLEACWLHDILEDTETKLKKYRISDLTIAMVKDLTDGFKEGNRAIRKAAYLKQVAQSNYMPVRLIKCADLISNAPSIIKHDPSFAKVYVEEAKAYLPTFKDVPERLVIQLKEMLCL